MCVVRQRPEASKKTGKKPWFVDYIDPAGERRQKTPKSGLKRDAEALRLKIANELEGGDHVPRSQSAKFSVVAEQWLEHCDQRVAAKDNLRARTVRHRRAWMRLHVLPFLGNLTMADMTTGTVQDWIEKLAYDKVKPRGRETIFQSVVCVRLILDFAFKKRLMKRTEIGPKDLRIPGRKSPRREIPSKVEIRDLIASATQVYQGRQSAWLQPFMYTACFSGLRLGELRALRWSKIDFARNVIRVDEALDDYGKSDIPKTESGNREVPIAPILRAELQRWREAAPENKDGIVFASGTGRRLSHGNVYVSYVKLQRRSICPGVGTGKQAAKYRFHDLRHVAASLFIETGLPPKRIQEIMGHSTITMTFDLYGHLFDAPDLVSKAIEKLGADFMAPPAVCSENAAIHI